MDGTVSFPERVSAGPCSFALSVLGCGGLEADAKASFQGDAVCRVCGGDAAAHGTPWRHDRIIEETFAQRSDLTAPDAPAVCGACAFFAVGRTFKAEVARRGLDIKLWASAGWRSYSHVFSGAGHIVPKRADWRSLLLTPPEPPFLAVMTTAGAKNLLFRGTVARDRELFPILVEETTVWVERHAMAEVLADFEAAYAAGLSKDSILTGRYSTSAVLKVGIARWQGLEAPLAVHRAKRLPLMRLAHFASEKTATADDGQEDTP